MRTMLVVGLLSSVMAAGRRVCGSRACLLPKRPGRARRQESRAVVSHCAQAGPDPAATDSHGFTSAGTPERAWISKSPWHLTLMWSDDGSQLRFVGFGTECQGGEPPDRPVIVANPPDRLVIVSDILRRTETTMDRVYRPDCYSKRQQWASLRDSTPTDRVRL